MSAADPQPRELVKQLIAIIDGTPDMPWSKIPGGTDNPAFRAARELVVLSPSPDDECATCGHERRQHIYHEGACRPGFTCPKGCTHFAAVPSPLTDADQETK